MSNGYEWATSAESFLAATRGRRNFSQINHHHEEEGIISSSSSSSFNNNNNNIMTNIRTLNNSFIAAAEKNPFISAHEEVK